MKTIALPVLRTLLGLFQSRALLHLEILALRQQLAMVNQAPRKRLRFHWGQRLAALVPRPRVNLTRFHGVFAPNSQHRALVTPAKRGKGDQPKTSGKPQDQTPVERRTAMTWAQRLKRVFNIDIETCTECGGSVKVIALKIPWLSRRYSLIRHLTQVKVQDLRKYKHTEAYQRLGLANISD